MAQTDRIRVGLLLGFVGALATASVAWAAVPPKSETALEKKAFYLPELVISNSNEPLGKVMDRLPNRAAWEGFVARRARGGGEPAPWGSEAFIDPRSGAAANLLGPFPLIPGHGAGNTVTLQSLGGRLGRSVQGVDQAVVSDAVMGFVRSNRAVLGVDLAQLGAPRTTQITPELWQVSIPQTVGGIRVRDARVTVTINNGNVVTAGTEVYGRVRVSTKPRLAAARALAAAFRYAGGRAPEDRILQAPKLEIVPTAPRRHQRGEAFAGPIGQGYGHRLVYSLVFQRPPEHAQWEVLVDAHSGKVVSFQDKNHYAERHVTGGVYPLTSTEICPTNQTCGTMQSGWPMPFADTGFASPNNFTNSAGVYDYTSGTATTTLTGRYVDIVDSCGAVNNSSGNGTISLGGSNGQHNCTTGGGGAGNTPASRSAFYEVNKLAEQARGWLPTNSWLQNRLTTNVNINSTCNAFWNGSSINFYRAGGGCRNTGELAAVFDHEWGHGLDDFDANGSLSNSSEAYADIAAIYRLQASCVGHGFFWTLDDGCGQTADGTGFNVNENQTGGTHCATDCSGVRDSDWAKHADNTPDTALGFVCSSCLTGPGPCGRQVHCAAAPVRQAAWDLVARDLTSAPFNYDSQTAFIVGNRLFYQGSGNVGAWHACSCGSSSNGCGSTHGYMQWLAADDDNGNLNDGTPHMTAIHAAYNRHGIACATPTPQNGGCSGGPTAAPNLTATPGDYSVSLSWNSVAGATRYWVFRTEGHAGCNFGKVLIATVTGTSYTDTQVANGRTYSYNVVAAGASSACYGRASNCANATPQTPTNPDFSVSCSPSSLTIQQGSSDTSTCTVSSTNGFSSAVSLSCTGLAAGASCSFSPSSVTPPANGSASSTLTVSVSGTASTGTSSFTVQGVSGALTRTTGMSLTVTGTGGGGDETAVFDSALQAPKCANVGRSCDTGPTLVLGRDNMSGGAETNQPNTISDSCADGGSGTFHSDESNDRTKVSTTDGSDFAPGKTVRIDASVWVWTTPSADHADFYYAANAASPSWTFIGTVTPTSAGAQTLSATYTLPSGNMQAVRVQFRYQGSASSCTSGAYNDRDDLAFAVDDDPPPGGTVFEDDFETNKGWITNPNGTDTASTGLWERADPQGTTSGGVTLQLNDTVSGVNCLVTEATAGSSAGVNDVDGGVTTIHSPQITLPGTGTLTLTFQYYLATLTNATSADFFRAFVVSGSTSTQVFQSLGAGTNRAGAWTPVSVNLGSFAGQTVRLRFEAADASTGSLIEAGVDDVKITQQ